MKRLLLLPIPALAAVTVTVSAPAGSLTLYSPATTVVYGGSATLSGGVSNQLADEPVTLTAQAAGKSIQSVDATTTGAAGDYEFTVSPTVGTTYQAHWRTVDSRPVAIDVTPRVGFGRVGHTFVGKVTSDVSYARRFVWLQRREASGWKSVRRVFLGANSRATFAVTLPRGRTLLRLLLPAGQAGAGYVAGLSRTLAVSR